MNQLSPSWYAVSNIGEIDSPALLVYPERIEENLRKMIGIAGSPAALRPHAKTHKMAEVVRLQMALGITKFKCATLAEAEMIAGCGAPDVLLAYPPVGPKVGRLLNLMKSFPAIRFATIADDAEAIRVLSKAASEASLTLDLLLDIDCGQHRSGVTPGPKAVELYRLVAGQPGLRPAGLHVYDGHISDPGLAVRMKACEAAFAPTKALRQELAQANLPVPTIVAGGTPTFPMHARRGDVECSPGTCILWDHGYATKLPDLPFQPAALVLTRVISKPGANLLCLDLGHKAIASENPHPRVNLLNLPDAKAVGHSEEHLVIETARAGGFSVGDRFYGVPWHICPTVALYSEAVVIKNGRAETTWRVAARDRKLTI
jgi:D-serine deaminase-like pyridoxal phosphate-dependent protein